MIKSNIKRLLQYRLCLVKFKQLGFSRVYSYNLGNEAGVSPEQVRKDFSIYGVTGNKKAGYEIDSTLQLLDEIFVTEELHKVIVVGMGNMGQALAHYNNRHIGHNIYIIAGFDIDPTKQNRKSGLPVFGLEHMGDVIRKNKVTTAILTVPAVVAQETCNILMSNGIKAILNFAPVVLKAPEQIVINNINLSTEIEAIVYYLKNMDTK